MFICLPMFICLYFFPFLGSKSPPEVLRAIFRTSCIRGAIFLSLSLYKVFYETLIFISLKIVILRFVILINLLVPLIFQIFKVDYFEKNHFLNFWSNLECLLLGKNMKNQILVIYFSYI